MFRDLEGQATKLIDSFVELSFYMRGSVQYEDFFDITPAERSRMFDFISKRLEPEMKKHMQVCVY